MRNRVMVVDDDTEICALLTMVLEEAGCEALEAHDGREALYLLENSAPSLILLDVHMPRMNGIEFLSRYHERPGPHARVVLLSSIRNAERLAQEFGADGFLAKPFDLTEVLRLLPNALNGDGAA